MDTRNLLRDWYQIPKGVVRLCFILINNLYSIPTYVMWMILLLPLRKVNPDVYWRIEGYFFHWLLAMVSLWSYSAGYDIVELGDDLTECLDDRTLVIANHQSTADVPLLFACFNPRKQILPNIMWIMDSVFKYTNFGIVSVLHKDFFIMSGKEKRDKSLQEFTKHLLDYYIPLKRKWLVLFPEGGFLRKRKAVSHRYAEKMNLPKFENVTLPRVGAMQVIMDTFGQKNAINNNSNSENSDKLEIPKIEWVLDITIAYPNGWPIDLSHIVFGNRKPCETILFYRLYSCKDLPQDSETLTRWLFDRWSEKEKMLDSYYRTGTFTCDFNNKKCVGPRRVVVQDYLRDWYQIPKGVVRLCFILINNLYSIPTYVMWMILLLPLRKVNPDVYWRIEGYFFHWLLAMVSLWSYSAGYDIVELGDDLTECLDDRTLVIANHQSTADVPLLFACFNPRKQILPNIMWIMDSVFKYTNFGIVSVLHKDFFIMSGKEKRDKSLQEFTKHLLDYYIPLKRKWLVLFPEGGFLRKRKAVSHRYAEKMNLPKFENVTLPRVGAMQVIMDTFGQKNAINNNSNSENSDKLEIPKIEWVLDITIAYPNGWPIDLSHIVFGNRKPCETILFYRLYSCKDLPQDSETLTRWLFDRWSEKEKMLDSYYRTGTFTCDFNNKKCVGPRRVVVQDYLRFAILHVFFLASTYLHIQMFVAAYNYYSYFVY